MRNLLKDIYVFDQTSNLAFTLAEVLVTLGIIGVISAMTLPTLTKNHQRKVYVTQLHKFYNELSQAGESYITSKNALNLKEAGVRSQNGVRDFVQSSFRTVKNCSTTFTDCFASEYKNMNGEVVTNYNAADSNCYILPSGNSVCLNYPLLGGFVGGPSVNVVVDVNGKQGPNILGRDLFTMGIYNDGFVGADNNKDTPVCKPGDEDCEKHLNLTDLQKCQQAKTISNYDDASLCFVQILDDGWEMEY